MGSSDPSGLAVDWTWYGGFRFLSLDKNVKKLTFQYWNESGVLDQKEFESFTLWEGWAKGYFEGNEDEMAGSTLAGDDSDLFWELQKMAFLSRSVGAMLGGIDYEMERTGQKVKILGVTRGRDSYHYGTNTLRWNFEKRGTVDYFPGKGEEREWHTAPAMVGLAHELQHCLDDLLGRPYVKVPSETDAMAMENQMRYALFKKVPGSAVFPRPGYARGTEDISSKAAKAWEIYWKYRRNYPI